MPTDGPQLPLRRFTVTQIHRLRDAGILAARTELLDGVLVDVPRPSARKQEIIDRLADMLGSQAGAGVMPRTPIHPDAYAVFDPTIMVHEWEQLPFTEGYRLHRFSVEDYQRMAEIDLVDVKRHELLDGVVLDTTRRRARGHVERVAAILRGRPSDVEVREWETARLGPYSLARLDVVLCGTARPGVLTGPEARLVIDVSDAADVTRQVRWPVYGRWGIEQAWLIDVRGGELHTADAPTGGVYGAIRVHRPGDSVSPSTARDSIPVAALVRS